jgi:hypothetical protein
MNALKKRLKLLELVAARRMPLDEARRARRGRLLSRVERIERSMLDESGGVILTPPDTQQLKLWP